MKCRYKDSKIEFGGGVFNIHSLNEILTGDDSVYMHDCEVLIGDTWKDLSQAFKDRDVIPNNENTRFHFPRNEEERNRGYSL